MIQLRLDIYFGSMSSYRIYTCSILKLLNTVMLLMSHSRSYRYNIFKLYTVMMLMTKKKKTATLRCLHVHSVIGLLCMVVIFLSPEMESFLSKSRQCDRESIISNMITCYYENIPKGIAFPLFGLSFLVQHLMSVS